MESRHLSTRTRWMQVLLGAVLAMGNVAASAESPAAAQKAAPATAAQTAATPTAAPTHAAAAAAPTNAAAAVAPKRQLSLAAKPWKGDFDRILQRRMLRVLLPYSRTLYFTDKGRERGITADLVREFERYVNQKYKTGKRPLTVYILPTTRDKLLPDLDAGLGDIAAGNLTVTDERKAIVDFAVHPLSHPVREVVVTGAKVAPIAAADELSGKTVSVRKSSSYYNSLEALNAALRKDNKKEVTLQLVPDALEDEDMLEMANAGVIDYMIIDDWKAQIWGPILPKLRVNTSAVVREAGQIGWAVRKNSPQLVAALLDFYNNSVTKTASYDYRLAQAIRRTKQMKDPTRSADWKRFQDILALFKRYGDKYDFDPLMLAAQGYQESQLNQDARSRVGAIGVMQLMPDTGAEMKVGDIRVTEANIHAGTKYMDQLMTNYFPDAHFTNETRPLFAFASYNCGPGNVSRMRTEAARRGLNPDKWFNNVEVVVAEKIGIETTTYVRNIYKYYVAYKLTLEAEAQRRKLLEQLKSAAPAQ
jgi:membrane-bound lytic murein transglycosylase MltF